MTDHERFQEMAGAYVLGALESGERHQFEDHLESCERCRAEVSSMAAIPGLLRRVEGMDDAAMPDHLVDGTAAAAAAEWRALHGSRRRWRWTAVGAIAVMVALAVVTLRPADGPADVVLAVGDGPVTGEVSIDGRTWGSALELQLQGLPPRDQYVAWVVDHEGARQQAATWGPTPTGHAVLSGASAVALADVSSVVITDTDGAEIIAFAATG